jgi:hypothetical protein
VLDSSGGVDSLLPLLGDDVIVLHGRRSAISPEGGGDVDTAVSRLDPLWPLRLSAQWRLCGSIHYDVTGWCWILERDQRVLALDTLEDPRGIGRLGFPSLLALNGTETLAPSAARAAYLTAKRLQKNVRDKARWKHVGALARRDPAAYRAALEPILGRRLAGRISRSVLGGAYPNGFLWSRARLQQRVRRFRSPGRAIVLPTRRLGRVLERIVRPAGLHVLIVGPDGAGKTTLAASLPDACEGLFRRDLRQHTRPKILPRPGALLKREARDWSNPHEAPPHGRVASSVLLLYYWLDFVLGGWVRIWPVRVRSGLVVVERGWWDLAVDPRRYRLQVRRWAVRALARLLPRPDIAFVLEAPAALMRQRKIELPEDEMSRQSRAWREVLPGRVRQAHLDSSRSPEAVVRAARDEIVRMIEERAISRLGPGWLDLPRPGRGARTTASSAAPPRLILARGPKPTAVASLLMYQPCSVRGRVVWEAGRMLAGLGGFRLLPRGGGPPRALRETLAPHLPPRSTYAVAESNDPGSFVAAVIDEHGKPTGVAKVALEEEGRKALEREADALISFGRFLPPPLSVPRLLAEDEGLLLFQPVLWRPRRRPWMVPLEVAGGLGAFYRAGTGAGHAGLTHGDVAPWNLLRTDREWVLIDWEEARENGEPFFDLFHYLVQAHLNLRRPSRTAFLEGLDGKGQIGNAIREYSANLGVGIDAARPSLVSYLASSSSRLDSTTPAGRAQLAGRQALMDALKT